MIYLAADHRGFKLKETLRDFLRKEGYEIEDLGAFAYDKEDDYVDFARAACEKIAKDPENHRGILICGSGHGMDIAANKYKNIRAVLGFNPEIAAQAREHENANVLVLPSDWLDDEEAEDIAAIWLEKKFSREEKHIRRLKKIAEIENNNFR